MRPNSTETTGNGPLQPKSDKYVIAFKKVLH